MDSAENTTVTVCSNEAYLYNLSGCPPKKRFKASHCGGRDRFQGIPLLPAKKRIQAFQFGEELRQLLKAEEEEHKSDHKKHMPAGVCRFCQTSGDSELGGELMEHSKGKLVCASQATDQEENELSVHVHFRCAEWAPNVYFGGDEESERVYNLESEMCRAQKLKCSACGVKGAALGCFVNRCRKSFHYTCAREIDKCKWDDDNYLFLCPDHALCSFRKTKS